MKLAVIDLDGVVANVDARFARAEEVKQTYLAESSLTGNVIHGEATNVYWRAVFDPAQVPLDTLIDGVPEAIEAIEKQDYTVFILTSRPESMRQATVDWLYWSFGPESYEWHDALIMKAPAFQYTKTVVWKAGIIATLGAMWQVDEILVVDDEPANLNEIGKYPNSFPPLTAAKSLAEAVAKLNGTWKEIDPFLPED